MEKKQGKNNAYLPNLETFFQAGIDPKTKLPIKASRPSDLSKNIYRLLQIINRVQKTTSYKWYNLPSGIDGRLIERILYFKGQGAFFYNTIDQQFYFLPFALKGSIDVYGRYRGITPLPFNGTAKDEEDAWIVGLTKIPQYDIFSKDLLKKETFENACVILRDYTQGISQNVEPMASLSDPILKMQAEALPFARTALLANSGIKGMRVNDDTDANQVDVASQSIVEYALTGRPFIPIKSPAEFQDLTSQHTAQKAEEYLLYYQAIDNLRKSFLGLPAGGIFEKKAQKLKSEQDMNSNSDNLIAKDGLSLRQEFCQMVNAIWGLGIWVEAIEVEQEANTLYDEEEMQNTNNGGNDTDVSSDE